MVRQTVKATLHATTRRFPVDDKTSYGAFRSQLQTLFSSKEPFSITYNDPDGDLITVSSDLELSEFFAIAKGNAPSVARIFLSSPSIPAPSASPILTDSDHINSLVSGVSQLLSAINRSDPMDVSSSPAAGPVAGVVTRGPPKVVPPTAPGSRKRLLSGLRPYMFAFPSGKVGLRKHLKSVSPDVKVTFKKLVRYIVNDEHTLRIVSALKEAFHILSCWVEEDLGENALPTPEAVDMLVMTVERSMLLLTEEEPTKRVIAFIHLALADEAVVNMLRETRGMGPMPWDSEFEEKSKKTARSAGPKAATDAATASGRQHCALRDAVMTGCGAERPAQKKGILAGLRPFLSSFPSGRIGLRKCAKSVAPELKKEFRGVVRYVSKSPNRKEIVVALKGASPILREFIEAELETEATPAPEKLQAFVSAVKDSILPKTGEDACTKICGFMDKALADEGVLDILRKGREIGPFPWEKRFHKRAMLKMKNGPRGFNVHHNSECSNCKCKPIVGSRFKCMNKAEFNLCESCHNNEAVNKAGLNFREFKYVWESIVADTNVPPAPLKAGDRGPRVKFLHKVLTDLGFMNEAMYAKRVGFYSPKTESAVQQFQHEQNMNDLCEDGIYDKATAERLEGVVTARSAQPQGSAQAVEPVKPAAVAM